MALSNIYSKTIKEKNEEGEAEVIEVSVPQDPLFEGLLKKINIDWYALLEMRETIYNEIEKAKVFLQITQKGK